MEAERDLSPAAARVLRGLQGKDGKKAVLSLAVPSPQPWLPPFKTPPLPPALAVFWKLVKRFMSPLPEFLPLLRCLSGEMGNEKEQMLGCSVLIGVQTTVGVRMRLGGGQPLETPKHKPEGSLPTPALPQDWPLLL